MVPAVGLPGDVVPQPHGGQRDEAEVQRLQEAPVLLQGREDPGRDQDEEQDRGQGQAGGVGGGQPGPGDGPAPLDVGQGTVGHQDHDPLDHHGEEEEGDGDPQDGEQDAEGLPSIRERDRVTVA